eukprot:CAMPEP_0181239176 /NCGR_PEP_ID=MMETSP1096-20121128/39785_1 /TAXON_ID=156174 ORGANISM="Chrysochromulina ericina, Strain CCMP281" /NCGR_SAMPLE_ID=MMETSP1096 /ASSEMBLY_ACC=CAM_ASM_000453 /LENGTH=96 /DNA_ID=CAMNT_0023334837 /DNA_START=273 /DNA_END=561 /DNA_ORIENTATION=-
MLCECHTEDLPLLNALAKQQISHTSAQQRVFPVPGLERSSTASLELQIALACNGLAVAPAYSPLSFSWRAFLWNIPPSTDPDWTDAHTHAARGANP